MDTKTATAVVAAILAQLEKDPHDTGLVLVADRWYQIDIAALLKEGEPVNLARFVVPTPCLECGQGQATGPQGLCARCGAAGYLPNAVDAEIEAKGDHEEDR